MIYQLCAAANLINKSVLRVNVPGDISSLLGGNLFPNNYYSGPVTTPLSYENGNPTDVIFPPTFMVK